MLLALANRAAPTPELSRERAELLSQYIGSRAGSSSMSLFVYLLFVRSSRCCFLFVGWLPLGFGSPSRWLCEREANGSPGRDIERVPSQPANESERNLTFGRRRSLISLILVPRSQAKRKNQPLASRSTQRALQLRSKSTGSTPTSRMSPLFASEPANRLAHLQLCLGARHRNRARQLHSLPSSVAGPELRSH